MQETRHEHKMLWQKANGRAQKKLDRIHREITYSFVRVRPGNRYVHPNLKEWVEMISWDHRN